MTVLRSKRGLYLLAVMAIVLAFVPALRSSAAFAKEESSAGICGRTQEVRDAILEKLSDVSQCADVSDSHLGGITGDLTLANKSISSLKTGDFLELTGLESLYLNNNDLSSLPDGIFEGLESLDTLWLNFNPGSPFSLTMTLEQEGSGSVVVKVAEGAPFDMQITLAAAGGTLSSTTVTVEGGSLKSEAVSVGGGDPGRVQVAAAQVTVSVESTDLIGTDYSNYFGLTREDVASITLTVQPPPGICGRTQEVQDAILDKITGVSDCADVTDTHLGTVWGYMGLEREELTTLKAGDFAGLSGLNNLNLSNNSIDTLHEDIFDGLTSLNTLLLIYTGLDSLPEEVFDGLSSLKKLRLNGNDLTELPEDVFDGLDLVELPLQYNDFSTLPGGVFDGLDGLTLLGLDNNDLGTLPDELFDGLESLTRLELQCNPGFPFTFTAELVQRDTNSVVIEVAQGAPYDMAVTVSAKGAALSVSTVTIDGGSTESETISVTPSGSDDVTVSVDAAAFLSGYGPSAIPELVDRLRSSGIQAGTGDSLTLQPALTVSGITTTSYAENGTTVVATYAVADNDATLTWSLSGDDSGDFSISSTGALSFNSSPDYESATDANSDNVYQVTIKAFDGTSSGTLDVMVTVTDVNEGPTLTVN